MSAARTSTTSSARPSKTLASHKHRDDKRRLIPSAEHQPLLRADEAAPILVAYQHRNPDLDPQLIWRGKYDDAQVEQTEKDDGAATMPRQVKGAMTLPAPPLYIQEKIHPETLIRDLREFRAKESAVANAQAAVQAELFADFNGLPPDADRTAFFQHDQHWSNRMILGDSLQVMASLAEREALRGKVQCLYFDPPYGIKFNSNFQWSTTSRDVRDGKAEHITREPEQVKAFRDTWRNGIHSYLSYLRDRLIVARDLLTDSGSLFLQIGDENVHRVRCLLDEVFGEENFVSQIAYAKTTGFPSGTLANIADHILWYAKNKEQVKYRPLYTQKTITDMRENRYRPVSALSRMNHTPHDLSRLAMLADLTSQGGSNREQVFSFMGKDWEAPKGSHWKTNSEGLCRLVHAERINVAGKNPNYVRFIDDFPAIPINSIWLDIGAIQNPNDPKVYVVQTATKAVQRCILMTTDPGDLVLDPTCGSGTSAHVAEQWGRRWITIDTSRVALALARARIMGARYPAYLLADTPEGQRKEAEVSGKPPSSSPTYGSLRHGFVYARVPHITLKAIANNTEIDAIWERWQPELTPLLDALNRALGKQWAEWEVPRESEADWPAPARDLHEKWWSARRSRQAQIDASISTKADQEYLYDQPYEDKSKVRVAGPFTVESLSPHRLLAVDENDELIDPLSAGSKQAPQRKAAQGTDQSFEAIILDHLKTSGVQQPDKRDKIDFTSLVPWPGGGLICAEGSYEDEASTPSNGRSQRRAAIFIGPEFGTVSRADLVAAAREAAEAGFDCVIACAFNYDAHSSDFARLGRIPILKARMNADLHMADDLKNTGTGNLFVIFGEPDIAFLPEHGDTQADDPSQIEGEQLRVRVRGIDLFKPREGRVVSHDVGDIACWFIDTDYNEESFFVRHAYFLGQSNPYDALKTTLKADISPAVWESLHSDTSRPFARPASGRIALKIINHLGDEVMKVYRVG